MKTNQIEKQNNCIHIECNNVKLEGWNYCEFHNNGGVLGNGDTYDQYQIIEQDFIEILLKQFHWMTNII